MEPIKQKVDIEFDDMEFDVDGMYDDDGGEDEVVNIEDDDTSEGYADNYGTQVDASEIQGEIGDNIDEYEIAGSDGHNLISSTGNIVVMDPSFDREYFRFAYVDIENIAVVKRIRKTKNVEDLVKSIKSTGLLMPIVVAPTVTEGIYVLLSGFRRLLACARVGMKKVPCIINTMVNTPEIPIIEAMYNHIKPYTMQEIIDYIDYLEKEKGIMSASMIEYLLQMESGDYTKLKDILTDNDPDIVSKLLNNEMTISQAFKKLEQRRKKESKEEKELKKANKVYVEDKRARRSLKEQAR